MKFLLGRKLDMTQAFRDDGEVIPVTRVQAGPCIVTQVKEGGQNENEVSAVQIGFEEQKQWRLNKPQQEHLQDLQPVKIMQDFRIDPDHQLERGDKLTVNIFETGEKVDVQGTTKGRGFQGVVKRHDFAGAPATHGTKDQHRMPGSAGPTGPSKVFKGKKMPGQMGNKSTTIQNLEIVDIKSDEDELLIKGGLPGAKGNLLRIFTDEGTIELTEDETNEEEEESSQQD
ncbi:MAG: 50S ribosomal protein L3 [Candidatus Paceibacteria bacterium]